MAAAQKNLQKSPFHMVRVTSVLSQLAAHPSKNTLRPGECLSQGSYLQSTTGQMVAGVWVPHYQLILQRDGNLVVYDRGKPIWASNTRSGAVVCMQKDGNFVLYDHNNRAIWASNTKRPNSVLILQNDGNLVIYYGKHPEWASKDKKGGGGLFSVQNIFLAGAAMALSGGLAPVPVFGNEPVFTDGQLQPTRTGEIRQEMYAGFCGEGMTTDTSITPGQTLVSNSGQYTASFQPDGNLVVYDTNGAVQWASGTENKGATVLAMQGDGNLVIYAGSNVLWASGTNVSGSTVHMQDDGNLVIYDPSNNATWASKSQGGGGFLGLNINIFNAAKGLVPAQAQGAFNLATKAIAQGVAAQKVLSMNPTNPGTAIAAALAQGHTSGASHHPESHTWTPKQAAGHIIMNGALLGSGMARALAAQAAVSHPEARAGAVTAVNAAAAKKSWWAAFKNWLGFKVT